MSADSFFADFDGPPPPPRDPSTPRWTGKVFDLIRRDRRPTKPWGDVAVGERIVDGNGQVWHVRHRKGQHLGLVSSSTGRQAIVERDAGVEVKVAPIDTRQWHLDLIALAGTDAVRREHERSLDRGYPSRGTVFVCSAVPDVMKSETEGLYWMRKHLEHLHGEAVLTTATGASMRKVHEFSHERMIAEHAAKPGPPRRRSLLREVPHVHLGGPQLVLDRILLGSQLAEIFKEAS